MLQLDTIHHGDCLDLMRDIPDGSIDMVLCDLPYGTTSCHWDSVIPFDKLWAAYKRVIKPNGAIVLTASQPFTSALVMSNPKWFRYEWIWDKRNPTGHLNAKIRPLLRHETALVFSCNPHLYQPQMRSGVARWKGGRKDKADQVYGNNAGGAVYNDQYYPTSILDISNADKTARLHPTQKPVALFEYLIKTYTNPNEVVLDCCMGSGTTAIAALNTGRQFIGIEQEEKYVQVGRKRLADRQPTLELA